MKYCVVIIDGAAGWPLAERGGKTCLELARTPNLDAMAREGFMGLVRTVPKGMEPSSACACMSILGYNPRVYYHGRSAIEARSRGIPIGEGEVIFRCNLVAVRDGKMLSYSAGYISTPEARSLIAALNENLGSDEVRFYPGVSYRHMCKIKGREDSLLAICIPPHDIAGKLIEEFLPRGDGSGVLRELMARSEAVLRSHPVNIERISRGDIPATMIWLFWGSGNIPDMPAFKEVYRLDAALTSGVDLLRGLAGMAGMGILDISGVTDGLDNDYAAQTIGALESFKKYDLVVIHVEAPDEAGHAGSIDDKVKVIQMVDEEMISRIRTWDKGALRVLLMPDHATPIKIQTHTDEPIPFMLWGTGFTPNGVKRFTEVEAKSTGVFIEEGYNIMVELIG